MIEAEEGDDLEVFVQNNLPVEQTIHWHGEFPYPSRLRPLYARFALFEQLTDTWSVGLLQRGTPDMDGVPGVTQVSCFSAD